MAYISWFDVIASADSALVAILRHAGAVFYSKTTMPQTGMMLETRSPLWGVTTNPFNNQLVSGGSSGGDGVLVAMRGSPIAPSSDIGGSIRAPAAFNGLYSIRPSADRIPKGGLRSTAPGNVSIKVSSGPVCHNIVDLKMFTKIINAHGSLAHFEPGIVPIPWRELPPPVRKLSFGVWAFDGVCMPHPPILRAIKETTLRLTSHGHEGTRFPRDRCPRNIRQNVDHPDSNTRDNAIRLLGGRIGHLEAVLSNWLQGRQRCTGSWW